MSESHIIRISAENIKKVKIVDFQPNRYLTKISGANGSGKTSALDAVFYALAGRKTLPASLIRQGQKTGRIRIETKRHIITRKLDDKGGALQIEDKTTNTLVKEPADWLKAMASDLGFDPLEFMRMKPEEQFEHLKRLVPMAEDVEELEQANREDDDTWTRRRAEMRGMEATRDRMTIDNDLPEEPIDIDALLAEARSVSQHNREIEQQERIRENERRERDQVIRAIEDRTQRINQLRAELERLEKANGEAIKDLGERNAIIAAWEPLPSLKNRQAIDDQISEASAINSRVNSNNANREQRERFNKDIDSIQNELNSLADTIRERKLKIARTLEKARFPIPGLSFETQEEGSGGRRRENPKKVVTYNGIPLKDASSGEQIRVSTAIGMAGKPELRFLLIREGSLLDDNGMEILEEMAHENDWQILVEVVDQSGKVGVYLEDGEVKAVNADAEEDPEPEPTAPTKKTRSKPKQGKMKYGDEDIAAKD